MALTIQTQILGQQANDVLTYCFIHEPLKIHITDSDPLATIIYSDITRIATDTGVVESIDPKYVVRDISSNGGIIIDLTKVIKQIHNFDTFQVGIPADIANQWDSVVSEYIYKFEFYTNQSATVTTILKLPIIGGRSFENFFPTVDHTTPIRELTTAQLSETKLGGFYLGEYTLKDISAVTDSDYSPINTLAFIYPNATNTNIPCGGAIYWKSKLGGWMTWGMDLKTEDKSHSYSGSLSVGMFESNLWGGGGSPYIDVDYTGASSSRTLSLKSLSRSAAELIALSEINGTPVVYFQKESDARLELMKLTSVSAPIKTHINGGDFTVSLSSISSTESKVK